MHKPIILVTGDLHGDINRLLTYKWEGLTKQDYLIVLGDFGLIYTNNEKDTKENRKLDLLNQLPVTVLFIDGNHENFNRLLAFPKEKWHGGYVSKIREHVIYLRRGEVFEIGEKKLFVMGGGTSVDKEFRTENKSWWPQEIPSEEEFENAKMNLAKHNYEVDYILTHSCSSKTLPIVAAFAGFKYHIIYDKVNEYLDWIEKNVSFKHWYFGHYHIDLNEVVDNQTIVQERIIVI